jgi:hypothetical protein
MALFSRFEAELIAEGRTPVSISPHREALESYALRRWTAGQNAYLYQELPRLEAAGSVAP